MTGEGRGLKVMTGEGRGPDVGVGTAGSEATMGRRKSRRAIFAAVTKTRDQLSKDSGIRPSILVLGRLSWEWWVPPRQIERGCCSLDRVPA